MKFPLSTYICDGEALCVAENSKQLKIFLVSATFAESMTPKRHKVGNGATGRDTSTLD
jgi:hypothetical protein